MKNDYSTEFQRFICIVFKISTCKENMSTVNYLGVYIQALDTDLLVTKLMCI